MRHLYAGAARWVWYSHQRYELIAMSKKSVQPLLNPETQKPPPSRLGWEGVSVVLVRVNSYVRRTLPYQTDSKASWNRIGCLTRRCS